MWLLLFSNTDFIGNCWLQMCFKIYIKITIILSICTLFLKKSTYLCRIFFKYSWSHLSKIKHYYPRYKCIILNFDFDRREQDRYLIECKNFIKIFLLDIFKYIWIIYKKGKIRCNFSYKKLWKSSSYLEWFPCGRSISIKFELRSLYINFRLTNITVNDFALRGILQKIES